MPSLLLHSRRLPGGKVRRNGSAPADEGDPDQDDPGRDERPANYDPDGEQLGMALQREPGIINGEGQYCRHDPCEDSGSEKDRSQRLFYEFVDDASGSPEVCSKARAFTLRDCQVSSVIAQCGDGFPSPEFCWLDEPLRQLSRPWIVATTWSILSQKRKF